MKIRTRKQQIIAIVSTSLAVVLIVTLGCVFGITHKVTFDLGIEGYFIDTDEPTNFSYTFLHEEGRHNSFTKKTVKVHIYNSDYTPTTEVYAVGTVYTFVGWCKDYGRTVPWLSTDKVTSDITLYAKWVMRTRV